LEKHSRNLGTAWVELLVLEALVVKTLWSHWWVDLLVFEPWLEKCYGSLRQLWVELLVLKKGWNKFSRTLDNLGRETDLVMDNDVPP